MIRELTVVRWKSCQDLPAYDKFVIPQLFFMDYAGYSGKLDSLRELLSQIKESYDRVLIFSQFRGMLDITEGLLQELGISSYKLTGSTPSDSRQEMTRAFNQANPDAFLISLKAGGVGLNLTGADTVILIDLWWYLVSNAGY